MSQAQLEIQLIAVIAAAACALPGVFLVLRQMAMMSDAVSHTVLLGIVLAFFLTKDLASPVLIIGATLMGLFTVVLIEMVIGTRLVRQDAAIGLVFPALFSLAVILISRYAGAVHLDADAVLLGELAFAPFNRLIIYGVDIGPQAFYLMGGILIINVVFLVVFYKELKLTTFDPGLAAALGFAPGLMIYSLMGVVSITAVGAFDTIGTVLVVAMMIAPPISAYLLTDRLSRMIGLSVLFGAAAALTGYWLAHLLDASIAGAMATMAGVIFGMVFLFAPHRGMIAIVQRRRRQRWEFAQTMLAIHLLNHEALPEADVESRVVHLREHLRWDENFSERVVLRAVTQRWVERQDGHLVLTELGRERARQVMSAG